MTDLMKYCTKCLYPDTKPDLWFDEHGVCSSCIAYDKRDTVDWRARKEEFHQLITKNFIPGAAHDCVVPVSGGKDSHYQVIKCLEHGMRVLAVCASTDYLTNIGQRNLNNIATLCDLVTITPNVKQRIELCKHSLLTVGDISWPEHVLIFSAPVAEAKRRGINLVIWGENPQSEYGAGSEVDRDASDLSTQWLQEYGGLNGMRVRDVIDAGILHRKYAEPYKYPECRDIKQVFLGYYFNWSGHYNKVLATNYGFESYTLPIETSGFNYENLDNYATAIHDYFKYIKYGFGRATDMANSCIKRGTLTRDRSISLVNIYDGWHQKTYMNHNWEGIIKYFNISREEFHKAVLEFTNHELFDVRNTSPSKPWPTPRFKVGG